MPTIRKNEAVLDAIYQCFAPSNPILPVTGFIDHATMGAEALVALGMGEEAKPWAECQRVRPYKAPKVGADMDEAWQQWLGHREAHGDWLQHFETQLQKDPYPKVLARWVPRFAHEVGAFLFHGLIRTAHATRALDYRDTPARRAELARGLALWAIGVTSPPAEAPTQTIHRLHFLHLARVGAAYFLDDPNVPSVHLVTGPMAYAILEPHLEPSTHALAHRSFTKTHHRAIEAFSTLAEKAKRGRCLHFDEKRRGKLVEQHDAHPIKLTEAALRAYNETRDDIFLKAAERALDVHRLRAVFAVAKGLLLRRAA